MTIEIYPFKIPQHSGNALFQSYLGKFKETIKNEHGHQCYVGDCEGNVNGYMMVWSYYEVDVIIHGPKQVEFICYDMECNVYGGRGREQNRFEHEFNFEKALMEFIEDRKMEVARIEYHDRECERLRKVEEDAIKVVYNELFK